MCILIVQEFSDIPEPNVMRITILVMVQLTKCLKVEFDSRFIQSCKRLKTFKNQHGCCCWLDSSHDNSTRQDAVTRLIFWLTPLDAVNEENGNKTLV